MFTEAQIPLSERINAQIALRYENMSDVEDSLVSKLAIGWEISDSVLFRASASTSFRAPNIVQINEKIVVRSGTRYDWAMYRLEQLAGLDQDDLDSRSSQRDKQRVLMVFFQKNQITILLVSLLRLQMSMV